MKLGGMVLALFALATISRILPDGQKNVSQSETSGLFGAEIVSADTPYSQSTYYSESTYYAEGGYYDGYACSGGFDSADGCGGAGAGGGCAGDGGGSSAAFSL